MIQGYFSVTEADLKQAFYRWELDARTNVSQYVVDRKEVAAMSANEVAEVNSKQFLHFLSSDNPL